MHVATTPPRRLVPGLAPRCSSIHRDDACLVAAVVDAAGRVVSARRTIPDAASSAQALGHGCRAESVCWDELTDDERRRVRRAGLGVPPAR